MILRELISQILSETCINVMFLYVYFSFISGITLLGTPTEIYLYGTQYMFVMFGFILTGIAMTYIYLPVFHDLQLTSTYHVSKCKHQ